ncbi:uncharacterized protein LOC105443713 [Strongylocentrotus purpuratus]|uniref:Uncharacterized protein n=1 Tax=Strongylocentrotus purpuratus TaxID=7668 RepID=A0A7M7N3Q6_STRPU|nr:uncharacterized protein LOC105443713 [Strongylocentrotus purpuratus]
MYDGSDDQAQDEHYDYDVGTLRHNDFPKHHYSNRNIDITVNRIIDYGRNDQANIDSYDHDVRHNDIASYNHHRIINYGRDDQAHDAPYDHFVRHSDIARNHHLHLPNFYGGIRRVVLQFQHFGDES